MLEEEGTSPSTGEGAVDDDAVRAAVFGVLLTQALEQVVAESEEQERPADEARDGIRASVQELWRLLCGAQFAENAEKTMGLKEDKEMLTCKFFLVEMANELGLDLKPASPWERETNGAAANEKLYNFQALLGSVQGAAKREHPELQRFLGSVQNALSALLKARTERRIPHVRSSDLPQQQVRVVSKMYHGKSNGFIPSQTPIRGQFRDGFASLYVRSMQMNENEAVRGLVRIFVMQFWQDAVEGNIDHVKKVARLCAASSFNEKRLKFQSRKL